GMPAPRQPRIAGGCPTQPRRGVFYSFRPAISEEDRGSTGAAYCHVNDKNRGPIRKGRHVRLGSKADMCVAKSDVRFTPNSDHESGHPQKVMSALPPRADMCGATAHVR